MNKALSENQLTTSTDIERRGLSVLCAVCGSVPQAVAEHPIIFSAPMVRAILEGRKTQTRRIIKPQPDVEFHDVAFYDWMKANKNIAIFAQQKGDVVSSAIRRCPYGRPGDHLWVREAFKVQQVNRIHDSLGWFEHVCLDYVASENGRTIDFRRWIKLRPPIPTVLRRRHPDKVFVSPSIHMPRQASRMNLHVTDVRIERLQDMSMEDRRAEGFETHSSFYALWDKLNPSHGYELNPFVWVVSFKACGTTNGT